MRIVLWVFICLFAALICGFIYLGVNNKEIQYQCEFEIAESRQNVFETYRDHKTWPHWMFGLEEVITPDGNQLSKGDRAQLVFSNNRKDMNVTYIVADVLPYERFQFTFEDASFTGSTTLEFKDLRAESCNLVVTSVLIPEGFLMRVILSLAQSDIAEASRTQYQDFKSFIETNSQ